MSVKFTGKLAPATPSDKYNGLPDKGGKSIPGADIAHIALQTEFAMQF